MLPRFVVGALALVLSCLPLAAAPEKKCTTPADIHGLIEDASRVPIEIETVNGAEAVRLGNILLLKAGWPPSEGISLLIIYRSSVEAGAAVFVGLCVAKVVAMSPRLLDDIFGARS